MTIPQLKEYLDTQKIPYKKSSRKSVLLDLVLKTKWYTGMVSSKELKKTLGFTAITQEKVTTQQVLDDFDSLESYEQGKRGFDDMVGYQLIGKKHKYYLDHYPIPKEKGENTQFKPTCQCLKKDGKICPHPSKSGSVFCGQHQNCRFVKGTVTPQQVRHVVKKESSQNIRKVLEKGGPRLSPAQKATLFEHCGEKCCPLNTRQCKYAICRSPESCETDCDNIRSAMLKKRLVAKKIPQQTVQILEKKLDRAYRQKHCGK